MNFLLYGPPRSGKTLNKETIAAMLGCNSINDCGYPINRIVQASKTKDSCLFITFERPNEILLTSHNIKVIDIDVALTIIKNTTLVN